MDKDKLNYQTNIIVNGRSVKTLRDILPEIGPIPMLIIGKTPAPVSVSIGHYFQGKQGKMLWNCLRKYDILRVPDGQFEDDFLQEHGYGITDIVKLPREFGAEPTDEEYKENWPRILSLMNRLCPRVIMFVYKGALDKIIKLYYHKNAKATYGFNYNLEVLFRSKIFVFPMPGTPCSSGEAHKVMGELQAELLQRGLTGR